MRVKKYVVSMAVLLIVVGVMRGSDRFPSGARYLIIAPDAYYDALLPLAQWKTQKGMLAKIAKLSETGYSAAEIKAYIQNAYNNWDPPPEYVFLVGNGDSIPFTTVSGVRSDCYYGNMDGDIYDEIIIGRFPAYNVSEVENYVNKVLNYEKEPYTGNWNWFVKATQMVEVDYDDDDSIYWGDVMHAESLMYKAGFIHVDMFSDSAGNSASDVYAAIENGRSFINFRGQSVCHWWSPFDVDPYSTNPGLKLPVIVSPTCGQVSSDFTCGSEWVRAGTVSQPRGGIAFCGPTTVITGGAYKRSALDRGFFDYVFTDSGDSIVAFGKGVEAGRKRYYELYGDYSEFYGFQCIADPELNIWTGQPRNLAVSYPQAIPPGPYDLSVHVEDPDGDPVKYALVCAMKDTSVYAYGYTDDYGNVTLSIETQPTDTVLITVTARNKIPYEGYTVASATGPYVAYKRYVVVDGSYGNGDGYVNPGETTELLIWVENIGTDPSYGVNGTLSSSDPSVTIIQNYANYGDLSPDDSAASSPLYRFQVAEACTVGQEIPLTLLLHDSDNNSWTQTFNIVIYSPEFSFGGISILDSNGGDGDGIPEPGETVDLFVTVNNEGNLDAQSPYGILSTSDLYVTILRDSSNFSTIPAGGSNSNNLSYRVSISSSCPNSYEIPFTLTMTTSDGFTGDVEFSITVGTLHDDMENGQGSWEHYAYSNGYNDEWHLESYRNHTPGGSYSWKCGGYGSDYYSNYDDAALVTPEFYLPDSSHLIFWHWMEAETSNYYTGSCYDGGAVYISINGGPFEQITPEGGYPYTIIGGHGNALPDGTPVFSGSFDWTQADFDLTGYSGNARIMFRFTSDQGVTLEGWYIDDVEIQTSYNPVPHIVVTPEEIDTSARVGDIVIDTILIQNTGDAILNFTVETSTRGIAVKTIYGFVGRKGSRQDWLEVTPTYGSVPPAGQIYLQVTLDATSLSEGTYVATIQINSNDPVNPTVNVPVTFEVYQFYPHIVVSPVEIDTFCDEGQVVYDTIAIGNTGEADLAFSITTEEVSGLILSFSKVKVSGRQEWLETTPDSGTVVPRDTAYVQVKLDATSLAADTYSAVIHINSNDTANPVVDVPVTFSVYNETALFVRGDANADGSVNVTDAVHFLSHLYPPDFVCDDAADFNDDGQLNTSDAIYFLQHFAPPSFPEPNDTCGFDPTVDQLTCNSFPPCRTRILKISKLTSIADTLFIGENIVLKHSKPLSAFQFDVWGSPGSLSEKAVSNFFYFDCKKMEKGSYMIAALKDLDPNSSEFSLPAGMSVLFSFSDVGNVDSIIGFYVTPEGIEIYPVFSRSNSMDAESRTVEKFGLKGITLEPGLDAVKIKYAVPLGIPFELAIYDVAGRCILNMSKISKYSGSQTFVWNGKDSNGRAVGPGIYMVKLTYGESVDVGKILRLK